MCSGRPLAAVLNYSPSRLCERLCFQPNPNPSLYSAHHATKLDCFGGWTGKKFKATGFFRVEKDKRWWLVFPEGNAFLSWGINQ